MNKYLILVPIAILLLMVAIIVVNKESNINTRFVSYTVSPHSADLKLYFKDDNGLIIGSLGNLRKYVNSKEEELLFATNGGMYDSTQSPVGLFIQDYKTITPLDTSSGDGNFYLKPNGIFYITTNNIAYIVNSQDFVDNDSIKYATQSGPMLVVNGQIHPAFKEESPNLNIRNGVGILPNGNIVFVMSRSQINFYDFASHFISLGCQNALYLDGYVSRTYLPEQNCIQEDGKFGVMIGVTRVSVYE